MPPKMATLDMKCNHETNIKYLTFYLTYCLMTEHIGACMHKDKKIIQSLGGTAKIADLLGYSVQRVSNWTRRGIPSKVKLDNCKLFSLKTKQKK